MNAPPDSSLDPLSPTGSHHLSQSTQRSISCLVPTSPEAIWNWHPFLTPPLALACQSAAAGSDETNSSPPHLQHMSVPKALVAASKRRASTVSRGLQFTCLQIAGGTYVARGALLVDHLKSFSHAGLARLVAQMLKTCQLLHKSLDKLQPALANNLLSCRPPRLEGSWRFTGG